MKLFEKDMKTDASILLNRALMSMADRDYILVSASVFPGFAILYSPNMFEDLRVIYESLVDGSIENYRVDDIDEEDLRVYSRIYDLDDEHIWDMIERFKE